MATKVQKAKVGAFLVLCFTLMTAGITYIAGLYERSGDRYWIEFDESVLGVMEGGPVEYLGVPIGKVDRISVTEQNRAHVELLVNPETVTLNQGVQAQLVIYSLAAGTMAVSLSGGDPTAGKLPDNSQIPTRPSTFKAVSSRIEELMENLNSITRTIESGLAGDEEGGKITSIINNVDEILAEGRGFIEKGGGFIDEATITVAELRDDAKGTIKQFDEVLAKVGDLADSLNGLTGELKEKVAEIEVAETQTRINELLENIAGITGRLDEAMGSLENVTAVTLHDAENIRYSLERALRDIGHTFDSVSALVTQIREDPSSLIRGRGKTKESD